MKNELNYDMDMCDNAQCPNAGSCMASLHTRRPLPRIIRIRYGLS